MNAPIRFRSPRGLPDPTTLLVLAAALTLSMACADEGPTDPPGVATCAGAAVNVRTLEPWAGTTVTSADVGCIALAGQGARYLVIPQFTGAALPYGGYGYAIGEPDLPVSLIQSDRELREEEHHAADDAQHRLERRLRHSDSEGALGAARRAPGSPARVVEPPDPGSVREFSVLAGLATNAPFDRVGAALAYVGPNVLLYVDTLAAAAFTPLELATVGALYDGALVNVVRSAFGAGSDIDDNGRLIFLLSPTVNAMVGAGDCAVSGYVRGFFYGHDLASEATTSNRGEIFYGYVPDPAGEWSCAHSKEDVMANLPPTFVHELQHMISYGEHVIERGGAVEEPWLNEGLSHVAEELGSLYFEQRYPAPLGRTAPTQLFPDSAGPYITPNLLYSNRYLFLSQQYSVTSCAPGTFCSLSERGAAWLFLRWLGDHGGTDVYRRLVETALVGRANLEGVGGATTAALFGDFVIAAASDSAPGYARTRANPRHRFVSRNFGTIHRALFDAYGTIGGVARPFPVVPAELPTDGRLTGTMRPGTFAVYGLRAAPSAGVALLSFTLPDGSPFAVTAGAQVSILRIE